MGIKDQDRIFTYLITSARGCVDEPPIYGAFRLLEAYSMLLDMLSHEEVDEFYFELDKKIQGLKYQCMSNQEQFIGGLDSVIEELTDHIINK